MIQLRLRTEYSFGQTFAPIDRVISRLKELGCTHAGIVDQASTWGHLDWFNKCNAAGIKPILGVELVVTDDEESTQKMWFLAKDEQGLRELYKASSRAFRQQIRSKFGSTPRLYRTDVLLMSDSIIKFSGDIVDGEFLKRCGAYVDIGPSSRTLRLIKENLCTKYGLDKVYVSDNSYAFEEDRKTFEFASSAYTKTTAQHIIPVETTEAARLIAEQCNDLKMPKATMLRQEGNLEELCREGIKKRASRLTWDSRYEDRLNYELDLIRQKDFESYFLIVADMVDYAKKHILVGPSRGSAAGSLVCYLSGITEVDPIIHNLYFERFIDLNRSDLPDIDLDFVDSKRHIVFEYMAEKYGSSRVSHIGTVSRYKPKSALIQVCKKLGIPANVTAGVKIAMIERSSADSRANNCLQDTFETTDPGRKFIQSFPQARIAQELEGHASNTSTHAAGLLVCNEDIENFCTVTDAGIAQLDKVTAEALGLLKIDVLGLTTLGILEDSGVQVDWYNLPLDDPNVYTVFNEQRMCGIFQFEGNAMRAVSSQMTFKDIKDIDAVTALARPGPFGGGVTKEYLDRKNGKRYDDIHPLVASHMKDTYGLPVYQEQTLAIVREIGKFDWKETSTIRKAMSKRMGKEFFDTHWEKFRQGAESQGIGEKEARKTWDMINSSGAWAMNVAHTRSYAVISYWTAWLKYYHPLEFAAASLRNAKDENNAIELLREMVKEGVEYVAFDPWLSEEDWCVKDGKLVAGLKSLHGFGVNKAAKYIEKRKNGKLTEEDIRKASARPSVFKDIFPMRSLYGHIYADPKANGVASKVHFISDLTGEEEGSYVFIGELITKNARNANEDINVKKRNGKLLTGPLEFLDIRVRDDTGTIGARVDRFKYMAIGKKLLESVPIGSHLMIRARMGNGIRFAFITNWKQLDIKKEEGDE